VTGGDRPLAGAAPGPGEALYLYCLARAATLPALDGPGVDGAHPLDLVPCRDVAAVVSAVRLDEFCGPSAEARMRDLAWVGPRAWRHEEVIERAMLASPVVPARFATLFSSRGRLAAWLAAHHDAIARALDRFADHEEWAVKGTLDRRQAEARLVAAALGPRDGAPAAAPGARYLEERRIRERVRQEVGAWLREVGAGIAAALRDHVTDLREREIGAGGVLEGGDTRVLNWACLVPQEGLEDLRARIQRLNAGHAEDGLVLELSGPWPPYSFCPSLDPQASA